MGETRQSRSQRRAEPTHVRLQERDLWILEGLTKMLFLRSSQISKLYFNDSRWAAQKRLRKLLDRKLIRVWVKGLSEENVYSLDRAGAKYLAEVNELTETPFAPRGLARNINHLLYINDVRVALALALPGEDGELISWRSDWELRDGGKKLIPDALFAVRFANDEPRTVALEVDVNTRSPQYFLKKIFRYETRYQDSEKPVVLIVGRDPKWTERYRNCLRDRRVDIQIVFTTLELIRQEPMGNIWSLPRSTEEVSLRTLLSSPYGREGIAYETAAL